MIDTTQNMDEQRLKIKQYLSAKGWTQQTLVRLTGYLSKMFQLSFQESEKAHHTLTSL